MMSFLKNKWENVEWKIYGNEKNEVFQLKDGKEYIKEYDIEYYSKLIFEGEYLNGERKKVKNMILKVT